MRSVNGIWMSTTSPDCQVRESVAQVLGFASTTTGAPFTLNVIDVTQDGTRTRNGNSVGEASASVNFVLSSSGYAVSCVRRTTGPRSDDAQVTSDGTNRLT